MNILYLVPTNPTAVCYGGQQRAHVIWKGLQTVGKVWTVCPVARKDNEREDIENRIYHICLDKRWSVAWFVRKVWEKFFPQIGIGLGSSLDPINRFDVKFDIVVVRTLLMVGRYRPWNIAPMYVDVDDTPSVDFALANPHAKFQRLMMEHWQKALCKHAKILWFPDVDQMSVFKGYAVSHLPNIPLAKFNVVRRAEHHSKIIVFIGYMAHYPNQVAINWFLMNFWAEVKKRFPDLQLHIVGGGLPEGYKSIWMSFPDVKLLGYVDDLGLKYSEASALIAPMQIGSGTCIKVLEALSLGVSVIATDKGLRGIPKEARIWQNGLYEFCDLDTLIVAIQNIYNTEINPSDFVRYIMEHNSQSIVNSVISSDLLAK